MWKYSCLITYIYKNHEALKIHGVEKATDATSFGLFVNRKHKCDARTESRIADADEQGA